MRRYGTILALMIAVAGSGCRRMDGLPDAKWPAEAVGEPRTNLQSACVSDYQAGVDYFPDKVSVTRATAFKVSYHVRSAGKDRTGLSGPVASTSSQSRISLAAYWTLASRLRSWFSVSPCNTW